MFDTRTITAALLVGLAGLLGWAPDAGAQNLGGRSTEVYGDYLEWSLTNNNYSGNAFDLDATATFTHQPTGQTITTPMFYDHDGRWKFRFTGTRVGQWSVQTHSADGDLNGWSGSITVNPASDTNRGFVVGSGSKWARQVASGSDLGIEAALPQLAMYKQRPKDYASQATVDSAITTFIDQHGFTGFHLPSMGGYWFDYDRSDNKVNAGMTEPDARTFEALERLITRTHAAGGSVHIWAWGDNQRQQTSDSLNGGQEGAIARRLEKYIAARLGPLPGWTMGYGFDLDEWTSRSKVENWTGRINSQAGWDHLLGGRPEGPNHGTDHSDDDDWNRNLPYASYEHHKPDYDVYVAALGADHGGDKPVFSEDRFRMRNEGRDKDYSEQDTRRGLWRSTMAGGVANTWGNLIPHDANHQSGSASYPNKQQIRTWSTFWVDHGRFTLDMERANQYTGDGAVALANGEKDRIVVYRENSDRVSVNVAGLGTTYNVFAVDAGGSYQEIPLGRVSGNTTVDLPHKSDWAVVLTTGAPPPPPPGRVIHSADTVGGLGDGIVRVGGLVNGATCFQDRDHVWTNVPEQLVGADYVMLHNDERSRSDFQVTVQFDLPADVYLLLDDRLETDAIESALNGLPFVDTGLNIDVDESGDGTVDNTSSIYLLENVTQPITLGPQDQSENMYGIAAVEVPEPTCLALLGLGGLVMVHRRG
jgi:hypothetical protein